MIKSIIFFLFYSAHRAILARSIKGLQDVIGMTVVHPTMLKTRENEDHYGWAFSTDIQKNEFGYGEFPPLEAELDPINNYKFVRDIYEAQGPYGGIKIFIKTIPPPSYIIYLY